MDTKPELGALSKGTAEAQAGPPVAGPYGNDTRSGSHAAMASLISDQRREYSELMLAFWSLVSEGKKASSFLSGYPRLAFLKALDDAERALTMHL